MLCHHMTNHMKTIHSSAVWIGLPRGGWSLTMWFHSAVPHMTAFSRKLGWSASQWPPSAGGLPHLAVSQNFSTAWLLPSKRANAEATGLKAGPGTGSHFCCIPLVKASHRPAQIQGRGSTLLLGGRTSGHGQEGRSSCQPSLETLVCAS